MTTQMDWMHYARFSKCAARAPSFPSRAASHLTCLAARRYHPDNMAKVPDLSLPEPVKGPEPLCKATATDVAKGLWGHALVAEIPYGPLDSSLKVRTPPARRLTDLRPSFRSAPPFAVQIRTNTITAKIGQQWNVQFEQNGAQRGLGLGLGLGSGSGPGSGSRSGSRSGSGFRASASKAAGFNGPEPE